MTDVDIELIKKKLGNYAKDQIKYNEPHMTIRCIQRKITKEEIEENLLNLEGLSFVCPLPAINKKEEKYELYFRLSSNRTLKLIAVFKKYELYVITVIMVYEKWQSIMKRKLKKHF